MLIVPKNIFFLRNWEPNLALDSVYNLNCDSILLSKKLCKLTIGDKIRHVNDATNNKNIL